MVKQEDYYTRMASSLGDKERLLPLLPSPEMKSLKVLDVGCGGGEFLRALIDLGYDAYGVDSDPTAAERNPTLNIVTCLAEEIVHHFAPNTFDAIVCSSVFHEVFSYGGAGNDGALTNGGSINALTTTIQSLSTVLKNKGTLLVRDGVMPDGEQVESMQVDRVDAVWQFVHASPFTQVNAERKIAIVPALERTAPTNTFLGTASSLMEFAFTYTWGEESFPREVREFYGLFTLDGYQEYMAEQGFFSTHAEAYTQPGYPQHLAGKVRFNFPFPASNAIWAYTLDKALRG